MNLKIKGLKADNNIGRGRQDIKVLKKVASAARLSMKASMGMFSYVIKKHLRSKHGYNSILLESKEKLVDMYEEIIASLLRILLKSKKRGLIKKLLRRAIAMFQIEPMDIRISRDATMFKRKLKGVVRIAQVSNNTEASDEREGRTERML